MSRVPPRGVKVDDLKCKNCGKTFKDKGPKKCKNENCPNNPKNHKKPKKQKLKDK